MSKLLNQPDKIYLQTGYEENETFPEDVDFKDLSEVTWCADKINKNDLEYVSMQAIEKAVKEVLKKKCSVCDDGWKECGCHTEGMKEGAEMILSIIKQEAK